MKSNKGFSLVELIIVVAIMAILVGLLAPQLLRYIEKTNVSHDIQFADSIKKLLSEMDSIIGADTFVEDGYIVLLVRMLGIAVVTKIASDICKDNSNNTLSTCVELFGKVLIFSMCLPLIKVIAELAKGLLV